MARGFRDDDSSYRRQRDDEDDEDYSPVVFEGARATQATRLALRVAVKRDRGWREFWVPQSVITDDSEVYAVGNEGRLIIKRWFARKEGLVDE